MGGGVNTNAYKCVQGGRGGLNITKNTHFVRRFIENVIISEQGAHTGITKFNEVLYLFCFSLVKPHTVLFLSISLPIFLKIIFKKKRFRVTPGLPAYYMGIQLYY